MRSTAATPPLSLNINIGPDSKRLAGIGQFKYNSSSPHLAGCGKLGVLVGLRSAMITGNDLGDRATPLSGTQLSTFIFTWNPGKWDWRANGLQHCLDETAAKRTVPGRWSTGGRTRGVAFGDRVFLLRQGRGDRGVVAAGTLRDGIFQEAHWDGSGRLGNYANLDWELVIDPDHPLPLADLNAAMPKQHWTPQASGNLLLPEYELTIEQLWAEHVARLRY